VRAEPPRLIFFDSGKPEITRDAADVLDEAIRSGSSQSRWTLVGYADLSGPEGANRRIALARAVATSRYLIEHGIAPEAILVRSEGESAPLIPTSNGVREPQNRRVEIQLR
jgi:OmpA-OmpF porin, OOP family